MHIVCFTTPSNYNCKNIYVNPSILQRFFTVVAVEIFLQSTH
ncbi:MAG: hypothetical protein [Malazfec virus 1]